MKQKSRPVSFFENLRKKLLRDNREIEVLDLGAGSHHHSGTKRKIANIARTSLTTPKFSTFYQRIIAYYNVKNSIELGTSLGINTLYLASKDNTHVTTFEGSKAIAENAGFTFAFAKAKNITLIEGDINTTLPTFLQTSGKIDLAFIDANHRHDPTLHYFDWILGKTHTQSIIILDDIHYSKEMEKAWTQIKNHPLVYASADLYRCGIVFFDPSLNKQHVVLQF